MKCSFLILAWNRPRFLDKCLSALIESIHSPADCEIVVMVNGPSSSMANVLARYSDNPMLRIITLDKNYGLNAFKRLYNEGRGDYLIAVDDDVLEFPPGIDLIFEQYMVAFPDYGYLVLNVVQNEFTNGAKPGPENYTDDVRGDMVVQRGPTGGWCASVRRKHFRRIRFLYILRPLSMKHPQDGFLASLLQLFFKLKRGIIKNAVCFHASGPYYASQFGHLDHEMQKYASAGMPEFVEIYKEYADKP